MGELRRCRVEGGTYFFTVALARRDTCLLVTHVALLREAVRAVRAARPFQIDAWVVLPDHLHRVWTLPDGDADYSSRWREIKQRFSRAIPNEEWRSANRWRRGERGIWQRRFWEHTIRDERDFEAHVNYIHLNPIKHGLVQRLRDWPYSTFHRYVREGIYSADWMIEQADLEAGE